MQIVVLAAGLGRRMDSFSGELPKSLVPIVGEHAYLELALKSFRQFSSGKKLIVGGHLHDKLSQFLNHRGFKDFDLLFNPDFHKGNLYSLLCAKDHLSEDFFIVNADHFYSPENYRRLFKQQGSHVTLFCDRDRLLTDDDMKVRAAASLPTSDLAIAKTLVDYQWGYVGVTFVPQIKADSYWQASQIVAKRYGDSACVEQILAEMAKQGESLVIRDISGSWWTEIDTPRDYEIAHQTISQHWPEIASFIKE